jgi:CheY-like chemotaxis protein
VRGIVELHGGSVAAHSDGPGKGSEFVLRLPASDATVARAGKPLRPAAAPAELACRRVLVVDDHVDAAESLGLLLRMWSCEAKVVHDGPAALELAQAWHPDAVVLDIRLPGMDGHEVARRLRGDPATAQALLVALTGFGREEDRRRAYAAGIDRYLVKPATPEALHEALATPAARRTS